MLHEDKGLIVQSLRVGKGIYILEEDQGRHALWFKMKDTTQGR